LSFQKFVKGQKRSRAVSKVGSIVFSFYFMLIRIKD